ncbi:MAG: transglycosylase SLT domain-containing protein [Armatimonadetes bacterium]|nr:transglycosylase SLT domain-containing protein [Armatimonadota bacterium]
MRLWRLSVITGLVILILLWPAPAAAGVTTSPLPADLAQVVEAVRRGQCLPHLSTLRSLSARPGPVGARAGYLLGHCLMRAGRTNEAAATFDAVGERYPPLGLYAGFYAAELMLRYGAAGEAADRLARLLAQSPSRPLARRARLARAEALVKTGHPAEAETLLRDLLEAAHDDDTEARIWWLRGVAAQQMRARARATLAYAMAWWGIPDNRYAEEAVRRLRDLSGSGLPDPPAEARLARAKRLLARGKAREAEGELVRLIHAGPPGGVAAEAWYHLGFIRWRSAGAADAFLRAARHPAWSARALYWAGRAHASAGHSQKARAAWLQVTRQHASSVWAPRSLLRLARAAEAQREWREADATLLRLATRYPESSSADEARWRRGWLRYRMGQFAEAEQLFASGAREFPFSSHAAANLYWAARARERQGTRAGTQGAGALFEQTAGRYPFSYYGQRALMRLGWGPPPWPQPPPVRALPEDRFAAAHEELAVLGFDREAADEAEALLQPARDIETVRFAAFHRARAGDLHASMTIADETVGPALWGGASADRGLWALAYPRAYWEQISAAARGAGVDPYLVLAVIREESRFDPQAVSFAGAVGLMQLLPQTAKTSPQQLFDAEVNIRSGAAYLGRLFRIFDGDVTLALAAYNAGPAAARRFARLPRADAEAFVESIPFAESRAYVKRVLESYILYRWLYP